MLELKYDQRGDKSYAGHFSEYTVIIWSPQ